MLFQPLPPARGKCAPRFLMQMDDRVYLSAPPYSALVYLPPATPLPAALGVPSADFSVDQALHEAGLAVSRRPVPVVRYPPVVPNVPSPLEALLYAMEVPSRRREEVFQWASETWGAPWTSEPEGDGWPCLTGNVWQIAWTELGDGDKPRRLRALERKQRASGRVCRTWDEMDFSYLRPPGGVQPLACVVNFGVLPILQAEAWEWLSATIREHTDGPTAHALLNKPHERPHLTKPVSYSAETVLDVATWQLALWAAPDQEDLHLTTCRQCGRSFLYKSNRAEYCVIHRSSTYRVRDWRGERATAPRS